LARSDPGSKTSPGAIPAAQHSLTINSAGVFLASVLTQLIGFIASLFLYKFVGISNDGRALLGTIQLFLLIGSSINGVADLRIGSAYTYFIARGKDPRTSTATYFLLRFAMVAGAGGILFEFAPLSLFGHQLAAGPTLTILGVFLLLPLLWSVEAVYNQMHIALGNSVKAQAPLLVESLVRTPLLIAAALLLPTIGGITLAYGIGAVAGASFALPGILPKLERFRRAEAVEMFRFAWPLMGSLALSYLVTNSIPFIVSGILGVEQLNIFNAANGFRILALSFAAAVSTPLFPLLSGLHKKEAYNEVRASTWRTLRFTAMIVVPGVLALAIYRVNFLYILANASYLSGATPLAILVLSVIPASLSTIIFTSLTAVGYRRLELYITALQTGALFGTAFLLMPPVALLPASDGLVSAAIAVFASSTMALAINAYFLWSIMAVRIRLRPIGTIGVSAFASFLAISQINDILPINRYYQLLFGVGMGFVVYFLVLALVGEFSQDDLHTLAGSVGLRGPWVDRIARICWRRSHPEIESTPPLQTARLRQTELPETFSGIQELPTIDETPAELTRETRPPPPPS
jgi:O-antigen/teichoic acid export membrane protein